ncbi:single-strand DNA endonuclease ASTE1-like [Aplochiton taeniatus]
MGVRGLSTLVNIYRKDVLEEIQFSNEKLVIDGSSLYYSLYYKSGLDQSHGGDYMGFRKEMSLFFQSLKACGIQPYVVLDGGSHHTDYKIETLLQRQKTKISRADQMSKGEKGADINVLPPLVKDVFKQVLFDLEVSLAQCFGEADPEVVSLANKWSCPVLSTDSDFYIYDIPAGFLHLSDFNWKEIKNQKVPATKYTTQKLSRRYNINPGLLPVFASVADWTLSPLIKGKLTSFIIDVLHLKRMILSPQIEDVTKPSGHATARPIRQCLYGLLLNGQGSVKEYDRDGEEYKGKDVPSQRVQLKLEELEKAPVDTRRQVLMEVLGVPWPNLALNPLPENLKLLVCVLHFWRNHSDLQPSDLHLTALLLGVVYGELCRQRREGGEFLNTMDKIKRKGKTMPRDLEVAHMFSQWQSCLKESLHLNQLLCFPLMEPDCAWLYCGPLVHTLVADLRSDPNTSTTLLMGDPESDQLFRLLLEAVMNLQH